MPLHNDALIEKESELLASLGDVTKRLKQVKEEIKLEKAAHLFHNEILGLFQLIGNDADDVRSTIEEVITNIAKAAQLVSGTAAQKVIKSI
jgi:hypothetical protein